MDANELFNEVRSQVFELLETGQTEIIFGEYVGQTFNVYLKSENEIEVEYQNRALSIECNDFKNAEYVARLIMHCFAKLYLKK